MSKEQLIEKLKLLGDVCLYGDCVQGHRDADRALLEYINVPEVTELFNSLEKFYA